MRRELTYATVCSGIECCSVACRGLPLRPVFFSEIEPFPCAVLKAHYPDVPNLGDMSKIQVSNNGKEITNGTVRLLLDARLDILAGGTPCQDVSVAGKRAVVECYDMTHADDPIRKVADGVSPTLQSRMGTGGNQVPLAVSTNSNVGVRASLHHPPASEA